MSNILLLETATKSCSVTLSSDKQILYVKEEVPQKHSHSKKLNIFIQHVFESQNMSIEDLDAIAVSKGPGSYTGLRIGVATAKGLCYALGIPLISVSTLQAMALGIIHEVDTDLYCPMIDARRMEVYNAFYDSKNREVREVRAEIISKESFQKELESKVLFFGDGANKCKTIINHPNADFIDGIYPSSKNMVNIAFRKYKAKDFEDIAYFEPYYLKDFVSRKKS